MSLLRVTPGSFVCEYVGELLTEPESERRTMQYLAQGLHPVRRTTHVACSTWPAKHIPTHFV